jgi:hypothetical protein
MKIQSLGKGEDVLITISDHALQQWRWVVALGIIVFIFIEISITASL